MNTKKPVALVILDGWGFSPHHEHNAIAQADPKTFNFLWEHYPHALLRAAGTAVGLPEGAPGNSEVGHLTIGAGRIIEQPISYINKAVEDTSFFQNPELVKILQTCKKKNGRLHLLGLLSDGLVHSNEEHLFALMQTAHEHAAHKNHIPNVYVHAFLDGRDVSPTSAATYLQKLDQNLQKYSGKLGSVSGRFYAMDRDENWERTLAAFDMLCGKNGADSTPLQEVLQKNYAENITDEFIEPLLLDQDAAIGDDDTMIFFNVRPDRIRQLAALFLNVQLPSKKNKPQPKVTPPRQLTVSTMVPYSQLFNAPTFFQTPIITNTLLDILEQKNKTIFTIAETEKYAHITYFFNGGKETLLKNETRILIPSKGITSYDQAPEMSAQEITDAVIESLTKNPCDFYLINYANADMVGHAGNFEATVKAVQCLDEQLQQLYDLLVKQLDGTLYITADHGKAEQMWDARNNSPHKAHTTNPVPFIMIQKNLKDKQEILPLHELADIASFILKNFF